MNLCFENTITDYPTGNKRHHQTIAGDHACSFNTCTHNAKKTYASQTDNDHNKMVTWENWKDARTMAAFPLKLAFYSQFKLSPVPSNLGHLPVLFKALEPSKKTPQQTIWQLVKPP